jgi:hypothetical protein
MRNAFWIAVGVAGCGLFLQQADAHHGWGGNTQDIELAGTVVRSVSLNGPHASMQIEDADGQLWNITLAPAPRTHRAGLREEMIPLGSEIKVMGRRNDDASVFEIKTRRVTWEDQNFDVY